MAISKQAGKKIWILVGTRPEVIKQTPLYWACQKRFGAEQVELVGTGQHKELLVQALEHFKEKLTLDLVAPTADASATPNPAKQPTGNPLNSLAVGAGAIFDRVARALVQHRPDLIVVQGDTTSAALGGLAAFYEGIAVAHNEAGLRSFDLRNPFPEEANRRMITQFANLHLAPTQLCVDQLKKEGVTQGLHFVGNTGIDALMWTLQQPLIGDWKNRLADLQKKGLKPVLMTAHRRENAGDRMRNWYKSLREFFDQNHQLYLICPIHPNNIARPAAEEFLGGFERALLCPPTNYLETCHILKSAAFVITDSGGIQEEAATLGVPAVVCRKTTERMEAVNLGLNHLADPDSVDALAAGMQWALKKYQQAPANNQSSFPFGHGNSAPKTADIFYEFLDSSTEQ